MSSTCPDCGSDVDFHARAARVLNGKCPDCGGTFTIVQEVDASAGPVPTDGSTPTAEGGATPGTPAVPILNATCGVCGGSLSLQGVGEGKLEAACASCNTQLTYVLEGNEPDAESSESEPEAPRRYPPRPREDRGRGREDSGFGGGAPRARPCRECGGVLRFSTGEDGNVTGECTACGNRFTLPPRRDGPGGGRPPYPRRPGGGFSSRSARPGGYSRGGGRGGSFRPRTGPPTFRRRFPRGDDDEEDSDRRRRRPRRE